MGLQERWDEYKDVAGLNYHNLPDILKKDGKEILFRPKQFIICRGEYPQFIYFVKSGTALGVKHFYDGNEFEYFQVDSSRGNIGLLEVLARKEEYVASVIAITDVTTQCIESEIIYEYIMSDIEMLRRSVTLVAQDLYDRSAKEGIFYFLNGINRVRYYLVDYYNTHDSQKEEQIIVRVEYKDIASSVGVSVRTVGRSIQQLKRNEEILCINRKIVLTKEKYEMLVSSLEV